MQNGKLLTLCSHAKKQRGKQRQVDFRQVVNAIFYRADNGIKWRAMPRNFPAQETVYSYYSKWVKRGLWESINALLVEQVRTKSGRAEPPSLGMIDFQSVKRGRIGQLEQGNDCNKKVKGRKRHVLVDVRLFDAGMLCQCRECC